VGRSEADGFLVHPKMGRASSFGTETPAPPSRRPYATRPAVGWPGPGRFAWHGCHLALARPLASPTRRRRAAWAPVPEIHVPPQPLGAPRQPHAGILGVNGIQSSLQGPVVGRSSDDQDAAEPPRTSDQWPMTHTAGESAKPEAGQAITGISACFLRPRPGQPTATRVGQGVRDVVVPAVW
jgi:hypothetical protein